MIINQKKIAYILFFLFLFNFNMVYADEISGKVSDADTKKPIDEATILCTKDRYKREVIKKDLTDSDGTYQIEDIPSDVYYISVEMDPAYESQTIKKKSKGEAKQDFSLRQSPLNKLKNVKVIEVNIFSNTIIVLGKRGEKIKLSTSAKTAISLEKMEFTRAKNSTIGDIKVGDRVSIKYYGTNKLEGKAAEIAIEGKNVE